MREEKELVPPDQVLRAFVALEISDEVRGGLVFVQERCRKTGARVGWVAPANIHLTLVFLGATFEAQAPPLAEALDRGAAGCEPFAFEVRGTGFYGPPRSPRVLWCGVRNTPALAALQGRMAEEARALGFPIERREFKPHLTLGRVRSNRGAAELTTALASVNNAGFGVVQVGRILLMQSHLERQGVRYSIRHEAFLKGAEVHGR